MAKFGQKIRVLRIQIEKYTSFKMKLKYFILICFFSILTYTSIVITFFQSYEWDKTGHNSTLKEEFEMKTFSFRYDTRVKSHSINSDLKIKYYLESQGIPTYDSKAKYREKPIFDVNDDTIKIQELLSIIEEYKNQHNYLKKYYDYLVRIDLIDLVQGYASLKRKMHKLRIKLQKDSHLNNLTSTSDIISISQ